MTQSRPNTHSTRLRHPSLLRQAYRWMVICLGVIALLGALRPVLGAGMEHSLDAVELNVDGQKHSNAPVDQRLQNLENQLNLPSYSTTTPEFRLSQIYQAEQRVATEAEQREAIQFYNKAIDMSSQGNLDGAIQFYKEAIRLNPLLLQSYNNIANIYEQQEKYPDAIAIYEKALLLTPKEPLLHRNMAVVYEKIGKIVESYDHYRQYIRLDKNPDPQIVTLVRDFDSKRAKAGSDGDYVRLSTSASQGMRLVWPVNRLPIPISITLTEPNQTIFVEDIHQGLRTWETISGGRIRFREVSTPGQAKIQISLKEGPLIHVNSSIGHASFNSENIHDPDPFNTLKIYITVNTGENGSSLPMANRKEQIDRVILHELGHAIGIWGHSPDPGDIMYAHPIVSKLSTRDVNTIRKLYRLDY